MFRFIDELTATILVIEDDRQIRRVVQGYLEQAGYRVLTAIDGDTGWRSPSTKSRR